MNTPRSLLILFSFLVAQLASAAEKSDPAFKPGAILSRGNTGYSLALSPDKRAASILFDNVDERLDGTGAPPVGVRVLSISVPLEGAEKGVEVGIFLRGFVYRLKQTDVSLIAIINGEAHAMDFAEFSDKVEELRSDECMKFAPTQGLDAIRSKVSGKQLAAPRKSLTENAETGAMSEPKNRSSFLQCVLFDSPNASELAIDVVLILHRHNDVSAGLLTVDSIDVGIHSQGKELR